MKRLVIAALALVAVFTVAGSALAASSQSATIYDSTTNIGPKSHLPSYGMESSSAAQIGGQVTLSSSKRHLSSATVTLDSFACVAGHWDGIGGSCATPVGAKYSLPVTLNIYNTDGTPLTSKTQTFDLAYRPSANPAKCAAEPTRWYSTVDKQCYKGLAQNSTFTFDGTTKLPDTFLYGIAYGTSHHGSPSFGDQACTSTLAGCFYDSLNVDVTDARPSIGTGTGTYFFDNAGVSTPADSDYTPVVQFKAGS